MSMKEYAKVCKSMQKYARVCKSMQKYARVCKSMQEYAKWHPLAKINNFIFFPGIFLTPGKCYSKIATLDNLTLNNFFLSSQSISLFFSPSSMCHISKYKNITTREAEIIFISTWIFEFFKFLYNNIHIFSLI